VWHTQPAHVLPSLFVLADAGRMTSDDDGREPAGKVALVTDVRPEVDDLGTRFDRVSTVVGDVSREDTAVRSVAAALDRFGDLDILVANAGRSVRPRRRPTARPRGRWLPA